MRLTFALVAIAALLLGVTIGLVARGERVEDLPKRATELATRDAAAAKTLATRKPVSRPKTTGAGPVQVAGLMVHRALRREGEYGEEMAFFGSFNATRVALELDFSQVAEAGARRIVSLQSDASTVTRFADDRGTDLTADTDFSGPYEMLPRVSADGLGLQTIVASKTRTHPQATRVIVEGSLVLLCASEKDVRTSESVALIPGSTLDVEPYSFEVVSTGASDWDPEKWSLELKTTGALDTVVSWSLVDESGEVLALEESMTWNMNGSVQKTLVAPRELERGALRLELWADGMTLSVPYSTSAGVGLR